MAGIKRALASSHEFHDKVPPISGLSGLYASPTRMADGRVALVGAFQKLTILHGAEIAATLEIPGQSIASAAASRKHLFVSTTDAFLTFDASTLAELGRIDWVGGGVNPPAIGPKGHVYAIASDILFVFPPPLRAPVGAGSVADPPGTARRNQSCAARCHVNAASEDVHAAPDRERQPAVRLRRARWR
jgi:hypothetical protein